MSEPMHGQTLWRVYRSEDGQSADLYEAVYVGRNHAWRTYRHPVTGGEWRENGLRWHPTREAALRSFIDGCIVVIDFSCFKREDVLRQLVHASHLLWRLWHKPASSTPDRAAGHTLPDAPSPPG